MNTSPEGVALMHYFEQCRLTSYPDPGSELAKAMRAGTSLVGKSGAPWTIGWGDTGAHVGPGQTITQAEADRRFSRRLADEFEPGVERLLTRKPSQCQFDAMVSLAYNIGVGRDRIGAQNATGFFSSSVRRKFNMGDVQGAADSFGNWTRSGGQVMLGLRRRRAAESALFLGSSAVDAITIGKAIE